MSNIGRLNSVVRAWESGKPAFGSFASADRTTAITFSTTPYDGVVFEMEHNAWDPSALQDAMQYLLDRRLIARSGSVASSVTPLVRIPPNGDERNQWLAKQALDRGAYGIIWPHISTGEQAMNAVAACRYPRPKGAPRYLPAGLRGDGPTTACRYWGLTQQEYYTKADVWPLDPNGEVLAILMIEDTQGIGNLRSILKDVPGVGAILIGEGDLSQELGVPRQYDHPEVRAAMAEIVAVCKEFDVPVGHPHVGNDNIERVLQEGYRLLLASPVRSLAPLEKGRKLAGR
ncbi:MAG TPA: aldolase/citrate lyase family protein [Steroidobacteraceae bacterium]